MTDGEWLLVELFLQAALPIGRPRIVELRTVVNAVLYMASTGCQWRQIPKEFAPYTTVQGYFYRWSRDGTWARISHALVAVSRSRGEPERRCHRQPVGQDHGERRAPRVPCPAQDAKTH